jgi:hypothetical protein
MNALTKKRRALTKEEYTALSSAIEQARYTAAALDQLRGGICAADMDTLTSQSNLLNGSIWGFVFQTKKAGF